MVIESVQYPSNQEAARAVFRHIQALPAVRHLRLQPAHAVSGAFDEWWLVPSMHRSPYRYGKLFVARVPTAPLLMTTGFCFHRGIGRHLDTLVDSTVVMDASWFWSRFLSDALAGAFAAPLQEMSACSKSPVWITLNLYHLDRAPGPRAGYPPDDRLTFAVDATTLALKPQELGEEELAPLTTASSLRELALWIESIEDLWWFWIDVYIGLRLRYAPEDHHGWTATDLWERALAPWAHWVH